MGILHRWLLETTVLSRAASLSLSISLSSLSSSSSLHCLSLSSPNYQHLHFFVVSLRGPWVKKLSLSSSSSLIGLRKREYSLCGRDRRDFSNGTKVSAPYFLLFASFYFFSFSSSPWYREYLYRFFIFMADSMTVWSIIYLVWTLFKLKTWIIYCCFSLVVSPLSFSCIFQKIPE